MTGLRQFTPPSMKGLNYNIDADLDLGATHGIKTDWISTSNLANALTLKPGATAICFEDDNHHIAIYGGRFSGAAGGALIDIVGSLLGGYFAIFTPNAAKNAMIQVSKFTGNTDTPYLDMLSHRIAALSAATTDMDAVPQTNMWGSWAPTLVWGTATPASLTTQSRYCQIGKTVFFAFYASSADSNACTSLTITLPVNISGTVYYQSCSGWELVNTTYYAPMPLMDGSDNKIKFMKFQAGIDAQNINISVTGFYEAA